jgi:PAS domain S-box-containing protein
MEAEELLKKANLDLERRVEERTAELAKVNEDLRREVEKRKRTEDALREGERKFRAIFDQTFQFIGLVTLDGRLIEANRTALQFAGVQESDVIGKLFWETPWWTHSTELQGMLRLAVKKAVGGDLVRFEATHPSADGTLHCTDFSLKPVIAETGGIVFLIAEARDIGEWKRAEEALRESEERFEAFMNKNPVIAWIKDEEGRYVYLNASAETDFGRSLEDCLGKNDLDLFPAERARKHREDDLAVLKGERPTDVVDDYTNIDGTRRVWWKLRFPMKDASGKRLVGGIGLNITERKQMEEELHKSRDELELRVQARTAELMESQQQLEKLYAFMRRVTDNVPDLIWAKDTEDKFLFVNKAMCNRLLMCNAPDDALGKTTKYFTDREKKAGNEHTFGEICVKSDQTIKEMEMPGRFLESGIIGNQYLVLDVHKAPFYSESGELIGTIGCGRDVTKEKTIEESLKKSEERYRLLASKLLSAQEEERKRIGTDLHDGIGQTLVAVKLLVEMALLAREEGNLKEALEKLKSVAPMLGNVIKEIRSIFTGLRPTMLDNLGLISTLQWFCMEFQGLHPEYRIEHKSLVEERNIPEQLKVPVFRIVQESLNNIAKHSNAEFVEIVLAENVEGLELIVSDNGIGMDMHQILQSNTARSLGLTSMRERAELTGGSFSIESTPGEGTTIRVFWPIEAGDQMSRRRNRSKASSF